MLAKKAVAAESSAAPPDGIDVKELITLLQQIETGMKKLLEHFRETLKQLRGELLKSRGQVYEIMKGAGMEVPEEGPTE